MTYTIEPEAGLVRCRAWGTLSNEELRHHYRELAADPVFSASYHQLADLSDVVALTADTATITEVASLPIFHAEARRAIIAPSDSAYGVSRMFAIYAERAGQDVRVFRDAREAEQWAVGAAALG